MKTTKFTKLAAVILALALAVSALVGVNVFAAEGADEGAATITNKNVDHGFELALCFAVDAGTTEGTVYVLVWDWNYSGEYTLETAQQKKTALFTDVVNGETRQIFVADSVAARDIDAKITFRTCIEKADGTCVYGAVESYSIIDYAIQRLAEIPTLDSYTDVEKTEQTNLCNAIIRYNEAAEAVLGKGAEPND